MNKIILDKDKNIELIINEDSICNISKDYEINELNIKINNNAMFIINHYSEINDNKLYIKIKQNDNSKFVYNHSFINYKKYDLNININLNSNNSKNIINIHGISNDGDTNIKIDGIVQTNTYDNELDEKIKMINVNNGTSKIVPNMFISTKNVQANHAASISEIDENYLFYLNSKGINKEDATHLIIEGFLKNEAK